MTSPSPETGSSVYGSREWLDREYRRVDGDPWGLEWRPSQVERYHQMIDVLRAQPRLSEVRTVLDIGCATGTFTAMLAAAFGRTGAEIRGSDVAELAISRARVRFPQLTFDCLSLEQAEERFAGAFDLITMLEVLYYVPEGERDVVIRRVRRMLTPGGMLLVSSMVARQPYMSPAQLQAIVGASLRVVDSGVLTLKPLALIEKPFLRAAALANRLRSGRPRTVLPERGRAVRTLARLAHQLLGERAVSHSYVVALAEGDGQA